MNPSVQELDRRVQETNTWVKPLTQEMSRVVVGQQGLVRSLLIGLLGNGHVLLEGGPGLAKTLTGRTLSSCIHADFARIQFTPDLLPADLVGTLIYNPREGVFTTRKGPIFANLILADEINRAPAKVQSALLEAMQERQVTISDETFKLPDPFLVLATQNPLEQEGTYPLPEAQLDRFMLKVVVGYPTRSEERSILDAMATSSPKLHVDPLVSKEQILEARTVEPYIKKFTEEREMTVMIVLDVSASGDFGSVEESKREMAAEVAAILAFSAIHNNDKVGLLLFSDRVELFIPPKKGRHHILRLIREMLYFSPQGRGTDLAGALDYMNKVVTRRAVVFVISDFLTGDFSRPLTVSAKRHDMVALTVIDPAEEALPDIGVILLEDPETGEQIEVDTSRRAITGTYARLVGERFKELGTVFGSRGVDTVQLRTDADYLPVLRSFFDRRGRRLAA